MSGQRPRREARGARPVPVAMACLLALCGCATPPVAGPPPSVEPVTTLAEDGRFVAVRVQPGDTLATLAARHLGSSALAWRIADFNDTARAVPGAVLIIPRSDRNPTGVRADGYQVVPVLTYHRIDPESLGRMSVSRDAFEAQMAYLAEHDYRVIPLHDLLPFLHGERALPARAVVITLDDGYLSARDAAYPVLRRHGFPATLFVYSDFVGRGGLGWEGLTQLSRGGLVSVQPHSGSHGNLAQRADGESSAAYRERVAREVGQPSDLFADRLGTRPYAFAYPYGAANRTVVGELERHGYRLGLTVVRGGNPAHAAPLMLRRTMVFGDDDLATFAAKLQTFIAVDLR